MIWRLTLWNPGERQIMSNNDANWHADLNSEWLEIRVPVFFYCFEAAGYEPYTTVQKKGSEINGKVCRASSPGSSKLLFSSLGLSQNTEKYSWKYPPTHIYIYIYMGIYTYTYILYDVFAYKTWEGEVAAIHHTNAPIAKISHFLPVMRVLISLYDHHITCM